MSHLPQVDGVQNVLYSFDYDLWPWRTTLTFDLSDLDPRDHDLGPPFLILGWNWNVYDFDLADLDLWPMTLTFKLIRDMVVLNACAKF